MPSSACKKNARSEEHTSELQSHSHLVCRLLLEKKTSFAGSTTSAASVGSPSTAPSAETAAPLLCADAELRAQHDERPLGRFANRGAVVGDGGVSIEYEAEREAAEV